MVARRPRHWSYSGEKLRRWVLRRDRYTCQIGGPHCTVRATTVDHIHPRAAGGTEHPDNLRAACDPCNNRKGTKPAGHRPDGQRLPLVSSWTPQPADYTAKDGEK